MKSRTMINTAIASALSLAIGTYLLKTPQSEDHVEPRPFTNMIRSNPLSNEQKQHSEVKDVVHNVQKQISTIQSQRNHLVDKMAALEERLQELSDGENGSLMLDGVDPALHQQEFLDTEREIAEKTVGMIQAQLQQEDIDPAWAVESEEMIATAFSQNPNGINLLDAKCKSTVCEIIVEEDIDLQDPDADSNPRAVLIKHFPDSDGFYNTVEDENGNKTTTLYISRNGHSLPVMEDVYD